MIDGLVTIGRCTVERGGMLTIREASTLTIKGGLNNTGKVHIDGTLSILTNDLHLINKAQ